MAGATRSIVINVPPEKLFDVIVDYEKYAEFLPEVKRVTVERKGNEAKVSYEVNVVKTIRYSLKMTEERPNKVSWSFIEGEFMKDNKGSWMLAPTADGKTHATYTVEMKLGALVPGSITTMLVDTQLPAMLAAFKRRAEASR